MTRYAQSYSIKLIREEFVKIAHPFPFESPGMFGLAAACSSSAGGSRAPSPARALNPTYHDEGGIARSANSATRGSTYPLHTPYMLAAAAMVKTARTGHSAGRYKQSTTDAHSTRRHLHSLPELLRYIYQAEHRGVCEKSHISRLRHKISRSKLSSSCHEFCEKVERHAEPQEEVAGQKGSDEAYREKRGGWTGPTREPESQGFHHALKCHLIFRFFSFHRRAG